MDHEIPHRRRDPRDICIKYCIRQYCSVRPAHMRCGTAKKSYNEVSKSALLWFCEFGSISLLAHRKYSTRLVPFSVHANTRGPQRPSYSTLAPKSEPPSRLSSLHIWSKFPPSSATGITGCSSRSRLSFLQLAFPRVSPILPYILITNSTVEGERRGKCD